MSVSGIVSACLKKLAKKSGEKEPEPGDTLFSVMSRWRVTDVVLLSQTGYTHQNDARLRLWLCLDTRDGQLVKAFVRVGPDGVAFIEA